MGPSRSIYSDFVEMPAKTFQHGLRRCDMREVVQLAWVVTIVKEFLGSVSVVADINKVTFGQGDERSSISGGTTLIGVEGIGAR